MRVGPRKTSSLSDSYGCPAFGKFEAATGGLNPRHCQALHLKAKCFFQVCGGSLKLCNGSEKSENSHLN